MASFGYSFSDESKSEGPLLKENVNASELLHVLMLVLFHKHKQALIELPPPHADIDALNECQISSNDMSVSVSYAYYVPFKISLRVCPHEMYVAMHIDGQSLLRVSQILNMALAKLQAAGPTQMSQMHSICNIVALRASNKQETAHAILSVPRTATRHVLSYRAHSTEQTRAVCWTMLQMLLLELWTVLPCESIGVELNLPSHMCLEREKPHIAKKMYEHIKSLIYKSPPASTRDVVAAAFKRRTDTAACEPTDLVHLNDVLKSALN